MRSYLPILLVGAVFATAACSPDDRPAPSVPLPSDPAGAPAPITPAPPTAVPQLPDPQAPDGPRGRDSKAVNPTGDLTSREESTAMPKPGQANNHSSPALDPSKDAGSK